MEPARSSMQAPHSKEELCALADSGVTEERTVGEATSQSQKPHPGRASKWTDRGRLRLNLALGITSLAAVTNGYDGSLINGLQALTVFQDNLGVISSSFRGLIIAAIALGGAPSFIPAAWVSDRIGRRWTSILGASIMAAASLVQAFTRGPEAFLVTRLFLGIGLAFTQTSAAPLVNELARPQTRAYAGAAYNAVYYFGSIMSAWVTFGTLASIPNSQWAWRIPCIVQAAPPLAQAILGLLFVPESPRWLISRGRDAEALKLLSDLHAEGDRDDAGVRKEYDEIELAIRNEREAEVGVGYLDFLRTPGNRWRLLIIVIIGIMVQWAGNGVVSYYFSPILLSLGVEQPLQRAALNGGLQVWNAVFSCTGAILAERLGRRPLWFLSAFGMLFAEIAVTVASARYALHGGRGSGYTAIVFLFLFFGAYDLALTPLNFLYVVEILPYGLRSKGLSLNQTLVFALGFFNQFANPVALDAIQWSIALLAAFIVAIYFVFPEVKGLGLEQIERVFDEPMPTSGPGSGPSVSRLPRALTANIRRYPRSGPVGTEKSLHAREEALL